MSADRQDSGDQGKRVAVVYRRGTEAGAMLVRTGQPESHAVVARDGQTAE
jgi:hypothetical protein